MSAGVAFCPRCGHRNPQDARYCSICGSQLASEVAPLERGTPPTPGPGVIPARDLGSIAAGILVLPVWLIGRTLVYFDLRVRKEGYNLDALSSEIGPQPRPAPDV